jgi:hypothetical protein
MSIGLAGLLLTAIGVALAALGYLYFGSSLWLMIPGVVVVLVGTSLLSGAREQVLSRTRHRISDSYDQGGDKAKLDQPGSGEH